ncbi:citrate/2-methylcitrate synthase [Paenibacillus arenilitoris]|uniref:Citrate synthase n=1 Tax=Paenibacillus arenilitoris TaxID=2772299 RepID=A0A927CT66_9BACL|nr:citrate/2-methylcitrate synthase [Paenibacillus arenilitoris]MBD2871120.1 citrate synthase/methylcitrate synthase [Paenibacillus arenilitoris]
MKQASVSGLEGVVAAETKIGLVDGEIGQLVYRGHYARRLAVSRSFEETAYLLWYGALPGKEQLTAFKARLAKHRKLTPELRRLMDAIPEETPPMSAAMSVVAALQGSEGMTAWPPSAEQAERLTAVLPVIVAYRHHLQNGTEYPEQAAETDHVAHYLHLLFGRPAWAPHVRAMNAYMVLAMEHGLNASTFAARVVASTGSDIHSAVGAAIGAMKGPLHGGAPSGVIKLLEEIGSKDNAEPYMRSLLERGERLMGFGHRIYKTSDPRAEALREVTAGLAKDDPWLDLAQHAEREAIRLLEEYKPGRKLFTNVEFYAAAVMRAVRMPPVLFTPTFTAARVVGWTAHVLEQSQHNRIFRPQSVYIGPAPSGD